MQFVQIGIAQLFYRGSFYRGMNVSLADHLSHVFLLLWWVFYFFFYICPFSGKDLKRKIMKQKIEFKTCYFASSVYHWVYVRVVCNLCFTFSTVTSSMMFCWRLKRSIGGPVPRGISIILMQFIWWFFPKCKCWGINKYPNSFCGIKAYRG